MFFIGQEHIMASLGDILTYTYETKKGTAILFRGASGYGKTELAKKCCNFLTGQQYEYCLGKNLSFNPDTFVHLVDEAHLLEQPEILYPIIDEGKYVFIFTTNFDSLLPEAFTNRCVNYIFTEYSDQELFDIFEYHAKIKFPERIIRHIIEVSGRNPRIMIKTFLMNLEIHYHKNKEQLFERPENEIIEEIDRIHGIKEGLDQTARDYLLTLSNLGGRASINLIAAASRLDINTIKYTIEPALLYKKKIKITQRGRELC